MIPEAILSPMAGIVILAILWLLIICLMVRVILRHTEPLGLQCKRFYLAPELPLRERIKILAKEKVTNLNTDVFNFYVVMPDNDNPVFSPSINQLAEAEFLVIEYLVPKHKAKFL